MRRLVSTLVLVLATSVTTARADLIVNGDFATTALTPWSV
jgi:hypothetical protein